MKSIIMILALVLNSNLLLASDYGDHHCNIFVSEAHKVFSPKTQFEIHVRVTRVMLDGDFARFDLGLRTSTNDLITSPKLVAKSSSYNEYVFTSPALGKLNFIAFMTNGVDSLYDNNFLGKMIELSASNQFMYHSNHCL